MEIESRAAKLFFSGNFVFAIKPSCNACRQSFSKSSPGFFAIPKIVDDVVIAATRRRNHRVQNFVRGFSGVKRQNQRLNNGSRSVKCARVAPRFQKMILRNVPVAQRGRFVHVRTQMNFEFCARQIFGELKICRRVENRIAAENNQRVNFISLQRFNQFTQRFGLVDRICSRAFGERHSFADVSQKIVQQMRERVNLRRLVFASNDNAFAAILQKVFGDGGKPILNFRLRIADCGIRKLRRVFPQARALNFQFHSRESANDGRRLSR